MSDTHTQFIGSIPEKYDLHLGPLFFHFYAEDLVKRISVGEKGKVLETGIGNSDALEVRPGVNNRVCETVSCVAV
ncbi:MAG: hypothetical protein OET44_01155 [Gammaproteobacteria bacterium]|nr:hypothetical protein [Gammaproteobacteria bacterium]